MSQPLRSHQSLDILYAADVQDFTAAGGIKARFFSLFQWDKSLSLELWESFLLSDYGILEIPILLSKLAVMQTYTPT